MTPSVSRANSGSQSEPHSTLTTFQPAPAYNPSSSWTIEPLPRTGSIVQDRKSTRLNSSHPSISYAVFCLKKKNDALFRSNLYLNVVELHGDQKKLGYLAEVLLACP